MKKIITTLSCICFVYSALSQIVYWEPEIEVASSTYGNKSPRIVVDGSGEPVVAWGDNSDNLYVAVWNGTGFNTPVVANGSIPALSGSNFGPDIAAYGDTIYAIFQEDPPTSGGIYMVRSEDGGASFGAAVQVDNIGPNLSEFVHVEVDDQGHPLALFNEFDPGWGNARWSLARSNDFGASFVQDTTVSGWSGGALGSQLACECCPASIDVSGNTVAVAYRDNDANVRDTWVAVSTDNAVSFSSGMDVDQLGWLIMSCPTTGPDCKIVGDTLYTVFMNSASGQGHVYYSKSELSSMTGGTATEITTQFTGLNKQNYPRLSIVGNQGVVCWQQTVNGDQQIVASYTSNIENGFPAMYDTIAAAYGSISDVEMTSDYIYVAWRDYQTNRVKFRRGLIGFASNSELDAVNIEVYPNPTKDAWLVDVESLEVISYSFYSLSGELIESETVSSSKFLLGEEDLPAGSYYLRIQTSEGEYERMLVKE